MGKSKKSKQSHNSRSKFNNGGSNTTSWNSISSQSNPRSRSNSASSSLWGDPDNFPALGATAAPEPTLNVWEERKMKQEAVKALEPQNQYDEEAMLQKALALSRMQALEEEKQRKEEEYFLQVSALENMPEELEEFVDEPEELFTSSKSERESPKEFSKETFLKNDAVSNVNENVKTYNSSGTRPKLNKIIESFGGWGLKDEKIANNSGNLSDFVEDVVNEKATKKAAKYEPPKAPNYQNNSKNIKANVKDKNAWPMSDIKEGKKPAAVADPWENGDILYDEKGTFIVDTEDTKLDDFSNIHSNSSCKVTKDVSPNEALDTWLKSDDNDDGWGKTTSSDRKEILSGIDVQNDKINSNCNSIGSTSREYKLFEEEHTPISNDVDSKSKHVSDKIGDVLDSFSKNIECSKSSWHDLEQENDLSQNNSEHNLTVKANHSVESVQLLRSPSKDIWADKNSTTYFTSFPDKHALDSEMQAANFCTDLKNTFVNSVSSNADGVTPILPPQPVSALPEMIKENKTLAREVSKPDLEEPPPILPPQPAPTIEPTISANDLAFNPMFPTCSPFLAGSMDPITMRQMLMLSNPFFASQLLAMERYYMSMGMPVMPVAPIPGMMGPTMVPGFMMQNNFADMKAFPPADPVNPLIQNHFSNGSFVPDSQSNNSSVGQTSENSQPVGLAPSSDNIPNEQSANSDSWYKSYSSTDTAAIIPPPKPPSYIDVNENLSVPEPSKVNQSASNFNENNVLSSTYIYENSSSSLSNNDKSSKPFSAIDACITKTQISGWSDDEDESSKTHNTKTTYGWNDDDGWGAESVPAKSFNINSVSGDNRKTLRQPSRQPQYSRYQRNKTYN